MRVALVHDHLNQIGGAEMVLKSLTEMFKGAPIHTLIYDPKQLGDFFAGPDIKTSSIQKIPGGISHFKWFLPIMPAVLERFDLSGYDLIISSSSALGKGVISHPGAIHISYCHTPTRYLWSDTNRYVEELPQNRIVKKLLPIILNRLRVWDWQAAQRVDYFIANSNFIRDRIKRYYQKDAEVIYPPVKTDRFRISDEIGDYFLIISRLRPYKKVDMAIKAFSKMGIPLKIIGVGEEEARLKKIKKMNRANIEFLGQVSEERKAELLSYCKALIHPQEEDFGITIIEAMASGRPVIAYNKGGALETVIEGRTGKFFEEQTWEALADAVIRFEPNEYNPQEIRQHAQRFDESVFREKIRDFINKVKVNH